MPETIEQSAISVSPDKHAAMVPRCRRCKIDAIVKGRRVIGSCKSALRS